MFINKLTFIFLAIISLIFIENTQAQLSKKHFIPPLTSAEFGNANPENQYFYISTPSLNKVSYTITPVGQPSSSIIRGVVSKTNPNEVFIGTGTSQLFVESSKTSTITNNKGYIIEADNVIYVSVRVLAGGGAQAGALVSKGASALGDTFRVGAYTNENPGTNYLNFVSVMATENNTNITFSDLPKGISIKNYTGSLPININLDEGESYIVATNSSESIVNRDGLIGALVKSNKPIVVNSGSANGSFHNGGGRDYGFDQIVGFSKVGREYIFVKGFGNNEWENVLIVAHLDNTSIIINGTSSFRTINAGEYVLIEGDSFNSLGNMYVETTNPVFAYQGIGGIGSGALPNEANQGLFFVPPLNCENRGNVDNIPFIRNIGTTVFTGGISIVTNKGSDIKINGLLITSLPPTSPLKITGPLIVTGNDKYVTYKIIGIDSEVSVESTGELYCSYFNQNGSATSGGYYSGFPSAPEITFNSKNPSLGNCIPNVVLEVSNKGLYDSYVWLFDDESGGGFKITSNTSSSIKPSTPGKYKLRGIINCTGTVFESAEIPISICPDDYDGDLVIDNLDIDIDNDGILNCEESKGNAILDLSNKTKPIVLFKDGSTNNSISSGSYTQTNSSGTNNTLIGNSSGNFTSTLNTAKTSNASYELNFLENVNFKFTQDKNINHEISASEFFTIKISPNNKNITLLDPDNQLLVDTNFDNSYESGNTYFSASIIRFKYAANLNGTEATFKFVADKVKQVIFEHNSDILTVNSVFNGTISLTCFALDSDNDGIEDAIDLDSDNDGIPDFFESTAQDVSLTKNDTNSDGLDDLFNTVIPNQDTDKDGVFNYLDIDSDNDGIYDVIEGDNEILDTNKDGVIDDANNTTVGKNGLLDALETFKDSGILKIAIKNSDSSSTVIINRDLFFNFVDLDSDGDDCFDTNEAGYTDTNKDGLLDTSTFAVNNNGKVINNFDGYTSPNLDYVTAAPIILNTPFKDISSCENSTTSIIIDSTADGYLWELSIDNGSTWNSITNNTTYNGTATNNLQITNTPFSFNNYQFRVIQTKTGNACNKTSNAIILNINPLPTIKNSIVSIKQCADNSSKNTIVNLTEAEINISNNSKHTFSYFKTNADAIAGTPEITDKEHYTVTTGYAEAWVRTISEFNCHTISKIEITGAFQNEILYGKTFEACDDFLDKEGNNSASNSDSDGIANFDFSIAKQEVINKFPIAIRSEIQILFYETAIDRDANLNSISDISKHRNNNEIIYAYNQTIYIKIKNKNNNNCLGIGRLFLKTNAIPQFSVEGEAPDKPITICTENIPYTLTVEKPADSYDYIWQDKNGNKIGGNTQSIQINEGGSYTVTANSRDSKTCSRTRIIVVQKSSFETLNESFITITDDTSGSNSNLNIQINIPTDAIVKEKFEYSLEDENGVLIRSFQESNIFNNIEGGIYNVIVKNKNGCGSSQLIVSLIQYPKFFTPNGDGINDTWLIRGANKIFYKNTNINIFNRYGKLMAETPIDSKGWDGTFNGKTLPSDNYWYSIQLIPIDTSKPIINKKGNFSLLRK